MVKYADQECTLLDRMGDDQTVANAARVSFGKRKECECYETDTVGGKDYNIAVVNKTDQRLINFLAREGHWTPFGHVSVQFHIKTPFFVARQLGKHQVGLVWNEISRRYVDSEPEFYYPEWRLRAKNKKQGSLDETIEYGITPFVQSCLVEYRQMLAKDIAPELARVVLPQNTMTEFYWSGSLYAFARICSLRLPKDAQKETREIAQMIDEQLGRLFPASWKALTKSVKEGIQKSEESINERVVNEPRSDSRETTKRQRTS